MENRNKIFNQRFWGLFTTERAPLLTAAFYGYVSVVGLMYNWIFFHAFGINILYFYELTDFLLSGLKWPVLLLICALLPLINHFLTLLFASPSERRVLVATIGASYGAGILGLLWLEYQGMWRLPGILWLLFFTSPLAALAGNLCRNDSASQRIFAINCAAIGSFLGVCVFAIVFAISNVWGLQSDVPDFVVFVTQKEQQGKGGGDDQVLNPNNELLVIGSTQKAIFFLNKAMHKVISVPWENIDRVEIACKVTNISISGCTRAPLQNWSQPNFDFLWPFSGKSGGDRGS